LVDRGGIEPPTSWLRTSLGRSLSRSQRA